VPQLGSNLGNEFPNRRLFVVGKVEKAGDVPLGDDQGVALGNGKCVGNGECNVVFEGDTGGSEVTEWAFLVGHAWI
jgi:hypothetical protein